MSGITFEARNITRVSQLDCIKQFLNRQRYTTLNPSLRHTVHNTFKVGVVCFLEGDKLIFEGFDW